MNQLALLLVTLALSLLAAPSARAQGSDAVFDPNRQYQLEIVTWTADRETEGLTWDFLVREYQRFRPNVRIKKDVQSIRTYASWATTQFKSGTPADIMQSFPWQAHVWGAQEGVLVPLRRYLNRPNPHETRDRLRYPTWMSSLYEELLEQNADPYFGEIWTMPLGLNTQRFYYNKDIFRRYDIKVPQTWSELGLACRQIRQRSAGAVIPIAMAREGAWLDYLGAGMNRANLNSFDLVKKDYEVSTTELLVAAKLGLWDSTNDQLYSFHHLMKKMNNEGWFQDGWTGFDTNQADNLFINGKSAMIREGYWMKQGFQKRIAGTFEFDVFREPYIDQEFAGRDIGRMLELMGSYGSEVAVTQKCLERGRLAAAVDFLQWMTSPEVAAKTARLSGSMPSTRDLEPYLPTSVLAFKPEVGGHPGGATFYIMSKPMQLCMQQVAPLYVSGEMELPELKQFMHQLDRRFVDLYLREAVDSTHLGIDKGARRYAQLIYAQDEGRLAAGAATSKAVANTMQARAAEALADAATTIDTLTDTEDTVRALIVAAYPREGAAGYRHVPLIGPDRGAALKKLGLALMMIAPVLLLIFLLRKKRLARMLNFPEKGIYLFLVPTILFILCFSYYPAFSAIYHAFTRWDGVSIDEFTGLENFREIFSDQILAISALNLLWTLLFFFLKLVPPLICAVVLYHVASARLRYYFRVMFVLPLVVPGIVYWMVWKLLYQPAPAGVFNQLLLPIETWLRGMGFDVQLAYNWIADPRTALGAIIFLGFPWVGTLGVLIYLAGLENIDPSLFEAAEIDGAGALKKFWYIELPLLMRQIKLNMVLGLIGVIQGFGTILFLTQGGPAYSTTMPGYQMYSEAFQYGRMGYASAIGLLMFVVILLATMTSTRAVKPQD